MKKLLAILMALAMCCSLVVSASAAGVETAYYSLDIDIDGEWSGNDEEATFTSDNTTIEITIMPSNSPAEAIETYNYALESYTAKAEENPNFIVETGDVDGCPGIVLAGIDGDEVRCAYVFVTDDFTCLITIDSNMEEFEVIGTSMENTLSFNSSFTGDLDADAGYEEDYEDDYVEDDYEEGEIVEEEEEIVEEEEEEKKPSKDDKEDKDEDKDDKDDKKDKEDDEDEDKGNNTTIIIIVVAVLAVAVVAAVVIVLSKKKK